MRLRSSMPLLVLGALGASGAGCAAVPRPPQEIKAPAAPLPSPAPPAFHALALTGRHAPQSAVVGPGGRVYVATMEELFVFSPENPSVGDRFPFHGKLAATPSGSQLYRTERKDLVEVDPSGVDGRKVTFGSAIESLAFSPSGALLAATTHEAPGDKTLVILRATDLREIARLPAAPYVSRELVWSPDDAYVVVGKRVIDTRTTATVYEHGGLDRAAVLFEGRRLYWLFHDLLEIVDLETGTSTQAWLPCKGASRAKPESHRFLTGCSEETIVTTVASGSPAFEHMPAGMYRDDAAGAETARHAVPSARVPADPRFSPNVVGSVLIEAAGMTLRDGEILIPAKDAPGTIAARVRLAPVPIATGRPTVDVSGSQISVKGAGGAELADIAFAPYPPAAEAVTVVGEKVVVWRPGWNPIEPPRDVYVCSFAGDCKGKFEQSVVLGVFGDELVAEHAGISGPTLVRENLRTGSRVTIGIPAAATALVGSEDGGFFVGLAAKITRPKATLFRVDTRSGKVESRVDSEDPSYLSARLLGLVGDRLVLTPDFGNYAIVVLLDARTLKEKEHYFFGRDSMLHVRENGTFETKGDAAPLENLILCTDGRRFGPLARCARAAR